MARVAFVQDIWTEYMGVMHMSAVLKQHGHSCEVFIDPGLGEQRVVDELRAYDPDIVGFSILTPSFPWASRLARRIKRETRAVTIFGNVHAIACPEIIEDPGIDAVCLGEGEYALLELADAISESRSYQEISGLWVKANGKVYKNSQRDVIHDLDALPFHDRELYDKYKFFRHSPYLRFCIGRGCPFTCSFCTNTYLGEKFGRTAYVRKRSPRVAVDELKGIIGRRKVKAIIFIDEVLWVKNSWLEEFLDLYQAEIHLPFSANFRFGVISEGLIKKMAAAGAATVIVASETADEKQRRELLNKDVSNALIIQICEWLNKYKIKFCINTFFGLPGDRLEQHFQRMSFFHGLKATYIYTTFFQPYPKLRLTDAFVTQQAMPENVFFEKTIHHDMFLNLPDREQQTNLKKVYFLVCKWPFLAPVMRRLIKVRLPLLFDVIFMCHFMYYMFLFEHISIRQFYSHIESFVINKMFARKGSGSEYGHVKIKARPAAVTARDR